jgi:hypothetical protein
VPALQLRCKTCHRTFDSGINSGAFPRPVLGPHKYKCPYCKVVAVYTNADFLDRHPDSPDFPLGVYAGTANGAGTASGVGVAG